MFLSSRISVAAETGDPGTLELDRSWNLLVETPFETEIADAVALKGGGWIIVGNFTSLGNSRAGHIARFNASGQLDPEFAQDGGANAMIWGVQLDKQGFIWINGPFTEVGGIHMPGLARLFPDGRVDPSFRQHEHHPAPARFMRRAIVGNEGISGVGSGIARWSSDGRLLSLYTGSGSTIPGYGYAARDNLVRWGQNGEYFSHSIVNASYVSGGAFLYGRDTRIYDAAGDEGNISSDDWLLMLGVEQSRVSGMRIFDTASDAAGNLWAMGRDFSASSGDTEWFMFRVHADGAADTAWGIRYLPDIGSAHQYLTLEVLDDGSLYVGGRFNAMTPSDGIFSNVLRYHANGELDTAFRMAQRADTHLSEITVNRIVPLSDGNLLLLGTYSEQTPIHEFDFIDRVSGNTGHYDTTFEQPKFYRQGSVYAIERDANGRILLAGDFERLRSQAGLWPAKAVARLMPSGGLDESFVFDSIDTFRHRVQALLPFPDGRIGIGGAFQATGAENLDLHSHFIMVGEDGRPLRYQTGGGLMPGEVTSLLPGEEGSFHVGMSNELGSVRMLRTYQWRTDPSYSGSTGRFQLFEKNRYYENVTNVHDLGLTRDGKIYASGQYTTQIFDPQVDGGSPVSVAITSLQSLPDSGYVGFGSEGLQLFDDAFAPQEDPAGWDQLPEMYRTVDSRWLRYQNGYVQLNASNSLFNWPVHVQDHGTLSINFNVVGLRSLPNAFHSTNFFYAGMAVPLAEISLPSPPAGLLLSADMTEALGKYVTDWGNRQSAMLRFRPASAHRPEIKGIEVVTALGVEKYRPGQQVPDYPMSIEFEIKGSGLKTVLLGYSSELPDLLDKTGEGDSFAAWLLDAYGNPVNRNGEHSGMEAINRYATEEDMEILRAAGFSDNPGRYFRLKLQPGRYRVQFFRSEVGADFYSPVQSGTDLCFMLLDMDEEDAPTGITGIQLSGHVGVDAGGMDIRILGWDSGDVSWAARGRSVGTAGVDLADGLVLRQMSSVGEVLNIWEDLPANRADPLSYQFASILSDAGAEPHYMGGRDVGAVGNSLEPENRFHLSADHLLGGGRVVFDFHVGNGLSSTPSGKFISKPYPYIDEEYLEATTFEDWWGGIIGWDYIYSVVDLIVEGKGTVATYLNSSHVVNKSISGSVLSSLEEGDRVYLTYSDHTMESDRSHTVGIVKTSPSPIIEEEWETMFVRYGDKSSQGSYSIDFSDELSTDPGMSLLRNGLPVTAVETLDMSWDAVKTQPVFSAITRSTEGYRVRHVQVRIKSFWSELPEVTDGWRWFSDAGFDCHGSGWLYDDAFPWIYFFGIDSFTGGWVYVAPELEFSDGFYFYEPLSTIWHWMDTESGWSYSFDSLNPGWQSACSE